jgi:hypothetical protein
MASELPAQQWLTGAAAF